MALTGPALAKRGFGLELGPVVWDHLIWLGSCSYANASPHACKGFIRVRRALCGTATPRAYQHSLLLIYWIECVPERMLVMCITYPLPRYQLLLRWLTSQKLVPGLQC